MFKKIILFVILILLVGCGMANIEVINSDGTKCKANYTNLFREADAININACGASGNASNTSQNTEVLDRVINFLDK